MWIILSSLIEVGRMVVDNALNNRFPSFLEFNVIVLIDVVILQKGEKDKR
jgi:hypothetical protein